MARDITATFDDGSSHVYENAPDGITFDQALERAQKDFSGKTISNIDGGRKAKAAPAEAEPAETSDAMGADLGSAIMAQAPKREPKTYTGSVFDTQPFNQIGRAHV